MFERYAAAKPAAEERPAKYRYRGGCRHLPPEYVGKLCAVIGEARRQTSVRVAFSDGLVTTLCRDRRGAATNLGARGVFGRLGNDAVP